MQISSEKTVFILDLIKLYQDVPDILDNCLSRILHSPSILKLGTRNYKLFFWKRLLLLCFKACQELFTFPLLSAAYLFSYELGYPDGFCSFTSSVDLICTSLLGRKCQIRFFFFCTLSAFSGVVRAQIRCSLWCYTFVYLLI